MTRTEWMGEDPQPSAMPVTEMLLGRQQRRAGPLEVALARSAADDARAAREEAAFAPDPDEHTGPDCQVCAAARERDAARAREDAVAVYGEITR